MLTEATQRRLVVRRAVRDVQSERLGLGVREDVAHHGLDQRGVTKGRQRDEDLDGLLLAYT